MNRVDDAGNVSCINLASIGQPAAYGAARKRNWNEYAYSRSTAPSRSKIGSTPRAAPPPLSPPRAKLTPEWLANYDVIIVQGVDGQHKEGTGIWTFEQSEVDALAQLGQRWRRAHHARRGTATTKTRSSRSTSSSRSRACRTTPMTFYYVHRCPLLLHGSANYLVGWDTADPISANITQWSRSFTGAPSTPATRKWS